MGQIAAYLWRKLDSPGYDACRLFRQPGGWRLCGTAVFRAGERCHFSYEVIVDAAWRTRRACVTGYLGSERKDLRVMRTMEGQWSVNGESQIDVAGCVDVDLGFTPATNLIALRRLRLKAGQRAEAPAAYLTFPAMRMVKLPQTYLRVGRTMYDYAAPTVGYSGRLKVLPSGVIVKYPGLFELLAIKRGSRSSCILPAQKVAEFSLCKISKCRRSLPAQDAHRQMSCSDNDHPVFFL